MVTLLLSLLMVKDIEEEEDCDEDEVLGTCQHFTGTSSLAESKEDEFVIGSKLSCVLVDESLRTE